MVEEDLLEVRGLGPGPEQGDDFQVTSGKAGGEQEDEADLLGAGMFDDEGDVLVGEDFHALGGEPGEVPEGEGFELGHEALAWLELLGHEAGEAGSGSAVALAGPTRYFPRVELLESSRAMDRGGAFQMSRLYSAMVRSEENFPMRATLRMDFWVQEARSWKASPTLAWASR